jgi:ABC-2 type transport system permease protein
VPAVLVGRVVAAAVVGFTQGAVVLLFAPLVVAAPASALFAGCGALVLSSASSAMLGLLVAARLNSVENFAGVINVVLFPLLFVSGALYPTSGMPPVLRALARVNPVTYQVDLMRHAFHQPVEFSATSGVLVLAATTIVAFALTALVFDPEQRFVGRVSPQGRPSTGTLSDGKA